MKRYTIKQFKTKLNKIYCCDCVAGMRAIPDNSVDLVITSPPYDNLRDYKGYTFNFEGIANKLYRIIKIGGVVVWIVGDATIKGSETGTSFKQALYFKEIGFNLHDTMIFKKANPIPQVKQSRYWNTFEYTFILSKEKPKTFNPIMVDSIHGGKSCKGSTMKEITKDQRRKKSSQDLIHKKKLKNNIWEYVVGKRDDKIAYKHPAIFPEKLAEDHILSWSNEGDIVLDPMCGSGTTCKMARLNGRKYIGFDISSEYVEIANKRLEDVK